jgi:hypothetical protein
MVEVLMGFLARASIVWLPQGSDIQGAIDALPAAGGTVRLGPGTFEITSTLTFPNDRPCWLCGAGMTEVDSGTGTIIHVVGEHDAIKLQWHNQRVSDLGITFDSTFSAANGLSTSVGIRVSPATTIALRNAENIIIENVWIEAAPSWGILFEGNEVASDGRLSFDSRIERCHIRGNWNNGAMWLGEGCEGIRVDACVFSDFNITGGVARLVTLRGCKTVSFNQCTFQNPGSSVNPTFTAYLVALGTNGSTGHNVNISFNQCHFEDGITAGVVSPKHFVLLDGISDCVSFNECFFSRTQASVRPRAINADGGTHHNLLIRGCQSVANVGVPYGFDDDILIGATCYGAMIEGGASISNQFGAWKTTPLVVLDSGPNTLFQRPTWLDPANASLAASVVAGHFTVPRATKAQLVAAVNHKDGALAFNTTDNTLCVCHGGGWYPVTVGGVLS